MIFSSGATSSNHNNNNNKFEPHQTYNPGILGVDRGTMLVMGMTHTFCSNIKCSLSKVLYTLAHLYKGTPLQPLRVDFFGIEFTSHPCSKLPFITFCGQVKITSGKSRRAYEHDPLPSLPTPETSQPPPPLTYSLPR